MNLALILGLVVACVVFIPLLLLCIFIFVRNRRDAAEFARFMTEREQAQSDEVSALVGFLLLFTASQSSCCLTAEFCLAVVMLSNSRVLPCSRGAF